jgi:hypothetical protein
LYSFREDGLELKNKKDEVQVQEVVGEEVLDDKNQSPLPLKH